MDNLSKFSERLDEIMFEHQTSVSELAKAIGTTKMTVYRYISKKRTPELFYLIKISDYYNCSLDFLLGITDNNNMTSFKSTANFSERFKRILEKYHTTEYFLHKSTGISRSVLYAWLSDNKLPSLDSLIKLSSYFDCSIDFLVGREN